ncbi:MAG: flippase-like domain-containing protein [Deltaproteobacteria bacterium]|nr:MAG: flippase-like domain-containing protein [Deltaproteobacteria bacterium]
MIRERNKNNTEIKPYCRGHSAGRKSQGVSLANLLVCGVVFIVLTAGIFWYQFNRIQPTDALPRWDGLQWGYLLLMMICLPIDAFACGLRMWVVCRVLQPGVSYWTCLKAECANLGVSMLTPSQSGGGFGQIYILSHSGVKVGTALTISLITFLGSMVGLLCIGFYSLLISGIQYVGPFFSGAIWFFTLILGILILSLIWPGLFRFVVTHMDRVLSKIWRWGNPFRKRRQPASVAIEKKPEHLGRLAGKLVDLIYVYQSEARRFLKMGKASFGIVCLLSLVFILSRCLMAFLCLRFLRINDSTLGHMLELQLALIFLVYFAPTPGGSAVAESVSLSMMAGIVPVGFAPYYNLLWRGVTLYIPAITGLLCVMLAMMKDVHKVVIRRKYTHTCLST